MSIIHDELPAPDTVQSQSEPVDMVADDRATTLSSHWYSSCTNLWTNYRWRMRHFFYIHLSVFFLNTLIWGAVVWRIEEYEVPFIDCWFISATCVFTGGLQTTSYAAFHRASQIILLIVTFFSGITVSTIPAIFIRIYRARRDTSYTEEASTMDDYASSDAALNERLRSLPNPRRLRLTAHIILIVVILSTCFLIHLFAFLAMGFWLKYRYTPVELLEANATIDPFYASSVITITGFNQNGLSPWASGTVLFVEDVFMNIAIMLVVICGTSLFPAILRSVVSLLKFVAPWRYKIFFDYILLNNHRLSTVIFPSVQTRLYVTVTILMHILGVAVAMIIDFHNVKLSMYTEGQRFMIFMFHVVNTRFGGFATINISDLSAATLIIFALLMSIKPHMLCTIHETPFEMQWVLLRTQQQITSNQEQDGSTRIFYPFKRMKHFLMRQDSMAKAKAKRYFARAGAAERHFQRQLSTISATRVRRSIEDGSDHDIVENVRISLVRLKLLLIIFCRYVLLGIFHLFVATRTWLFIAIFLICAFEAPLVMPNSPTITVFRITFEVVSAFGGCGLTMGVPNVASGLASVLSTPSKMTLIMVMCMGRHRGLLEAMKDQEEIEYSAQTIIHSWKQVALYECKKKKTKATNSKSEQSSAPPLITRF